MSRSMMTGLTAILGAGGGGGGGLSGVNTLLLNGSDQYATVPYDPSLDVSNEATVSIWAAPANQGGDQVLISNTNELLNAGFEIRYNGSTKKITVFARISGTNYTLESNASLQVDTFSHVALTYDTSDDLKLYIDGSLDNTLSQGALINLSPYDIGIGARKTTLSAELFFSGSLALPIIENASRDLSGIQELATPKDPSLYTQTNMVMGLPLNAGSATPTTDTTANANDATLQGATTPDYTGIKLAIEQVQDVPAGPVTPEDMASMQLWLEADDGFVDKSSNAHTVTSGTVTISSDGRYNGNDAYLFNSNHISLGTQLGKPANFTVIAAYYSRVNSAGTVCGGGDSNASGIWGNISPSLATTHKPRTYHGNGSSGTYVTANQTVVDTGLNVMAVRYTDGDVGSKIFANGVEITDVTVTGSVNSNGGTALEFSVGRQGTWSNWFNGDIMEVAVSDAAETDQYIIDQSNEWLDKYGANGYSIPVDNGDFANGSTNWTLSTGVTVTGGEAVATLAGTSLLETIETYIVWKGDYRVTFDYTQTGGTGSAFQAVLGGITANGPAWGASGTYTIDITLISTFTLNSVLDINTSGGTFTGTIDNVTLERVGN